MENAKLPVIRDLIATCTSETYDDSDLQRFIACLRHFHVRLEADAVRTFMAKAYEKDEMGNNPLMKEAVERGDAEAAQLLLRFEARGRVRPIVMAVERFDVDLAELLLAKLKPIAMPSVPMASPCCGLPLTGWRHMTAGKEKWSLCSVITGPA